MNDTSNASIEITWNPGSRRGHAFVVVALPNGRRSSHDVNAVSASARAKFVNQLCSDCQALDREALAREIDQIGVALAESIGESSPVPKEPSREALLRKQDEDVEHLLSQTPERVRLDAEALLVDKYLVDYLLRDFEQLGVAGERILALTTYMVATSRLLAKPLSAIVQGPTSTGKSYVPRQVARLIPPEAILTATDITPNALYYAAPGSLMHKFVLAGERRRGSDDEHAEATRALREIIESGGLDKAVSVKSKDGHFETRLVRQPGPIAYMDSTTNPAIFDEDANRCLLLGTDESQVQTDRIVRAQARAAQGCRANLDPLIVRYHTLQRLLKRVEVIVPFADAIAAAIPTERQEARRAMPQFLGMIQAVALLHQHQRRNPTVAHGDTIEATHHDYVIARRLMVGPLSRSLGGGLPRAVAAFGERLRERCGGNVFSTTEALQNDPVLESKSKVNEYLRALCDAGIAECVTTGKGPQPAFWRILCPIPVGSSLWLPTVDPPEVCP